MAVTRSSGSTPELSQTALTQQLAGANVLLVAPHPDDESLAMGGLLQHALRRHAMVTVVQLTNGDNNPWPQRVLERRLRIAAADRRRWGERRTREMHAALHKLGGDDVTCRRLGWPDMGVTSLLQTGDNEATVLTTVLREVAPDLVVLPALGDRHPDHASAHVLLRLALAQQTFRGTCLSYYIHGPESAAPADDIVLPLDDGMCERKRAAIRAHHTQVALAGHRLLAQVRPEERFGIVPARSGVVPELTQRSVLLPWHPPRVLRPWLQLTLAHPDGTVCWSWRQAPLTATDTGYRLVLPRAVGRGPVFVRLASRLRSPWIFDHWGWQDLTAAACSREAA